MTTVHQSGQRWSRRALLATIGGGATVALAACGAPTSPTAAGSPATTASPSAPATRSATPATTTSNVASTQRSASHTAARATTSPTVAPSAAVSRGQTALAFWGPFNTTGADITAYTAMKQVVQDFQAQQPGMAVDLVYVQYTNQTAQKLLSAIAAGQPPDVYYADRFLTATWAYKGIYTDLTPYNAKAGITADQYLPFAWNEATWQGKQWALPLETDCRMLYLNRDTVQARGLDPDKPPQTTAQLLDWTDKLTQVNPDRTLQQVGFWPAAGQAFHEGWMKDFGGSFFDEQAGKCTADSAQCVDAFTYMQTYAKRWGTQTSYNAFLKVQPTAGLGPFGTGKLAMQMNVDHGLIQIKQLAPNFAFSLAPLPGPTGPGPAMAGGFALTLPKGGRQVADAFTFARYAGGPQGMRTYTVLHGNIPVLKSVAADPVFRADPHHAQFMDQLPHAWNRPVTIEAQLLWNEMGTAQADVMNLKADPKSALSDLTQRVNAQLQLDAQQH